MCSSEKQESMSEDGMAFKPNYGRDRAERARAARVKSEEKQRKKDEKAALRKAEAEYQQVVAEAREPEEKSSSFVGRVQAADLSEAMAP